MSNLLFEDQVDDIFLKVISSRSKPTSFKNKLLQAPFVICAVKSSPSVYFTYLFELYEDGFVLCRNPQDMEEVAFMNINHSFIKRTKGVMVNGVPHFGLKLIKRKVYEELLSPDEALIDQWTESIKQFCILTKFRLFFESRSVLGKGNFAKVFNVIRKSDGREFAVKAFNKGAIINDELEKKFLQNEIKIMRIVKHERLMRLYEVYEGENFIYCLVELCKGSDLLKSLIQKGPQPEAKALAIIKQILEALNYLHSIKVIHRDLKPENILFKSATDQIDICIVDFGFATLEEEYKKLFVRCGTPGYVAPEVLLDKDYNCKADVFSVGVIFFMM